MRQDTPAEEEDEEGGSSDDESSEESGDDEWLNNFEDDIDVEMEDAGVEGEGVVKRIPNKLSIKVHED